MMGSEGLAFHSVWIFLRVGLFWICWEQFSHPPAHIEALARPKALASFRKSRRDKRLNACMEDSPFLCGSAHSNRRVRSKGLLLLPVRVNHSNFGGSQLLG